MKASGGFTLIEIIIVVIMIGILAGMSVVRYSNEIEKSRGGEAEKILLKCYSVYQYLMVKNRQVSAEKPLTWDRLGLDDPNLVVQRYFNYYILKNDTYNASVHADRIGHPDRFLYIDLSSSNITKTEPY